MGVVGISSMEKFAALGVCHRPLSLRQISSGIISFSRDHRRCGFLYRWERPCFEERKLVSRRKSAAVACLAASESGGAVEEASEALPMITTTFSLKKKCEFGERFAVVGADPLLGAWDPVSGIPMQWSEDNVWKCQVDLPVGQEYEYKFVLARKKGILWQPGPNRTFTTSEATPTPLVVFESWDEIGTADDDDATTQDEPTEDKTAVANFAEEDGATTDSKEHAALAADELPFAEVLLGNVSTEIMATVVDKKDSESSDSVEDIFASSVSATAQHHIEVAEDSEKIKDKAHQPAATTDGNESESSSSESSKEDEDGTVTVHEQSGQSKTDVPEDSKGFKSFKFEAALKNDQNGQRETESSESESSEEEDKDSQVSASIETK